MQEDEDDDDLIMVDVNDPQEGSSAKRLKLDDGNMSNSV